MESVLVEDGNKKHDTDRRVELRQHSLLLHEDDVVDYDDSDDEKDHHHQQDVSSVVVEHDKEEQQQLPSFVEDEEEGQEKMEDQIIGKRTNNNALLLEGKSMYYVPPARRREQEQSYNNNKKTEDNNNSHAEDMQMQRKSWDQLKARIQGTVNRWNIDNVRECVLFLFQNVNLIRGRGLLARSILTQAAAASSSDDKLTQVAAAVVAVINSKLPEVGELILARALSDFKQQYYRSKRRNNNSYNSKTTKGCIVFLGHLINQAVAHEIVALQILELLLQDDSNNNNIEIAMDLVKVCASKLQETSPNGLRAVLERFRHVLHQGEVSDKLQYAIEDLLVSSSSTSSLFYIKHPVLDLDLVEEEDQITHETGLDDIDNNSSEELAVGRQDALDTFAFDDHYEENEQLWSKIRAEILGEGDEDDETDEDAESSNNGQELEEAEEKQMALVETGSEKKTVVIQDLSEQDLIHLRRTIYLTIMSSASFEECAHKLASLKIPMGRENELVNMLIECCSQERTFIRYYGLIGQRFCLLRESRWATAFSNAFAEQYTTIHRLETNKLRNVAKLFAHLFHTDAISWEALEIIHMNEEETTSSSRIFVKILVQEMAEAMGIELLKQRFFSKEDAFPGLFPKDNPRNTRYAINFFTSIGLGPLTEGLREHLKNAPMLLLAQARAAAVATAENESASSSTSSSDSSSSDSSSSSSSIDERRRKKHRSSNARRKSYRRSSSSRSSYTSSSSTTSYTSTSRSYTSSSSSTSSSYSRSPSPERTKKRSSKRRSTGKRGYRESSPSTDHRRSSGKTRRDDTKKNSSPDIPTDTVNRKDRHDTSRPRSSNRGNRRNDESSSSSSFSSDSRSSSPSVPRRSNKSKRDDRKISESSNPISATDKHLELKKESRFNDHKRFNSEKSGTKKDASSKSSTRSASSASSREAAQKGSRHGDTSKDSWNGRQEGIGEDEFSSKKRKQMESEEKQDRGKKMKT